MDNYKRHKFLWKVISPIAGPIFKPLFACDCKKAPEIKAPYLVLANHNTDIDPGFLGFSFSKQQMYFVASEHVYRAGLASAILRFVFEPIAKRKGTSDALTVMKAIRTLREGKNVCLFPEGQRSFNGRTGTIAVATGKLVKASKAALVTYKFEGGYFTTPRWGKGIRRGKMSGHVVNIYDPETLAQKTPEEITEIICKDLYEDAYERQKENPIAYKGKKLAEGMESALCVCQNCQKIDTLSTKKNSVFCESCGFTTDIDVYGYYSESSKFKTLAEWDDFQTDYFKDFVEKNKSEENVFLFSDDEVTLKLVKAEHQEEVVGTGKFEMYTKNFSFKCEDKELDLPLCDIVDISMHGRQTLVFSDNKGNYYELTSSNPKKQKKLKNVRKYIICFDNLK